MRLSLKQLRRSVPAQLVLAPGGAAALPAPAPALPHGPAVAARRLFKHPRLAPFNRLILAVVLLNLCLLYTSPSPRDRS